MRIRVPLQVRDRREPRDREPLALCPCFELSDAGESFALVGRERCDVLIGGGEGRRELHVLALARDEVEMEFAVFVDYLVDFHAECLLCVLLVSQ